MVESESKQEILPGILCDECGRRLSNLPTGNGMEYFRKKTSDEEFEIARVCCSCALELKSREDCEYFASARARKSLVQFRLRAIVIPK